jgi:retinol dehydrogenase 12
MSCQEPSLRVLITGATAGIGYATAERVADTGATVIVHGRTERRVRRAVRSIRRRSGVRQVHGIAADLADLDAVDRLASDTATRFPALTHLIHNAAVVPLTRELTPQGFERQFAVNHLAPFLLTRRLLTMLQNNAPARIIFVASQLEREGQIDFDDLQSARRYDAGAVYATTKLANVLTMRALARRLTGTRVTVNALHPGIAGTNVLNALYRKPTWMAPWTRYRQPGPEEAAETIVRLALDQGLVATSGSYFHESDSREPSGQARNHEVEERLWRVSCSLLGIDAGLPIAS